MRHGADHLRSDVVHENAFNFEAGYELGGSAEARINLENNDVGFDLGGAQFEQRARADGFDKDLDVGVVVGEAVDVVFQGVQSGGGDDAGLTHAASQDFARAAR